MVYVRIHVHENDRILAACDEDILAVDKDRIHQAEAPETVH